MNATAAYEFIPDATDRLIAALGITIGGDVQTRQRRRRQDAMLMAALRLAPTLEIGEALLRGEKVPVTQLDPEWAKAYGLR